jgi:signal peptidase I
LSSEPEPSASLDESDEAREGAEDRGRGADRDTDRGDAEVDHDPEPPRKDKKGGEPPDEPRALPARPPRVLRYLFYVVWLFAVPLALALTAVRLLKPSPLLIHSVDWVRRFVGEQQVPAAIMFFTLFAMILWRLRHVLPLAGVAGVVGRTDLPTRLRGKYDDASQLLMEGRRILANKRAELARTLTKKQREAIVKALDQLEAVMREEKMAEDKFHAALAKADTLVAEHLGRWRKGELREYTESIGVAVAVALILRFFVIEAFKIPSGSMIPTLMIGDHIFVAKYAYGPLLPRSDTRLYEDLPPERGDVMVFKFPENKQQDFIKRVIALPGDILEAVDGRPVINGWLAPHCKVGKLELPSGARGHLYLEYLADKTYLTMYDDPQSNMVCKRDADCGGARSCRGGVCGLLQGPYHVAQNEVWVMGDNRNNSHDSRSWRGGGGAGVPFENIKGRAMFVWWSWDPRGGVALDRLFVNVMGPPKLPPGMPEDVSLGLDKCKRERPPIEQTTPPPPGNAPLPQ